MEQERKGIAMIDVKDMTTLSTLGALVPLSVHREWLDRPVREVAVMDAEPLTGDYQAFVPGDAVFTSLGFSGGREEVVDEAIRALFQRDIACVFVKDTLPYTPSEAVVAESRRRCIPLYRYGSGLIEQIISEARALIAEDAREDRLESVVRALMDTPDGESARRALREVLPAEGGFVQAAMLSLGEGGKLVASAFKSHLSTVLDSVPARLIARFEEGIMVLLSGSDDGQLFSEGEAASLVAGFGSRSYVGLSEVLPSDLVPTALVEARAACRQAEADGVTEKPWTRMGRAGFQAVVASSALGQRACAAGLGQLAAWDEAHKGDLVASMAAYVDCGGDINQTAAMLCQHPNSLRNRLANARKALSMDAATDKELFAYLSMLYL